MQQIKLFFQDKCITVFETLVTLVTLLAMLLPFHADRITAEMQGSATTETAQIVFTVTNKNHRSITYAARGEHYEMLTDSGWVRLFRAQAPFIDDDFAYGISPRSSARFYLSPQRSLQMPMTPGRYRFVLPYWFSYEDINEKDPVGTVIYEFTLTAP